MSRNIIRKISIGDGFPDKAIHYQVGNKVKLNGVIHEICNIMKRVNSEFNVIYYEIFIKKDSELLLWKEIIGVPVVVEFKIDFE